MFTNHQQSVIKNSNYVIMISCWKTISKHQLPNLGTLENTITVWQRDTITMETLACMESLVGFEQPPLPTINLYAVGGGGILLLMTLSRMLLPLDN